MGAMTLRRGWLNHSLGFVVAVLISILPLRAEAQTSTPTADLSAGIESYREFTLSNGLRVVFAVDHRVPQVALRIEYAVGDALDPPEQRGMAQLIAAILPKLETRHLRSVERPRLLEAAGFKFEEPGSLVTFDATAVTLQVPAEALELALWLEADRMSFAADGVTQALISNALPRAQERVELPPNHPEALTVFRAALGRSHPYGGLDRSSNLSAVKADDVAKRLRRYYNAANAALVLVGDLDVKHAEESVRRLFESLPAARVTQPPAVHRPAKPQLISLTAAIPAAFSALVWETPAWFAADDAGLDVVATVLSRRLEAKKLCDKTLVRQRSRRLTSVFIAACEGDKTSPDTFREALGNELSALAEGRVPAADVEAAALTCSLTMSDRIDDLHGRAQMIASSVLNGHGAHPIPDCIQDYLRTDAASVAAIVRRHLLRPADGRIEVTPQAGAPPGGSSYFGHENEPFFRVPPEALPNLKTVSTDWPRPPANGAPHRFQPPTGPTDTLPNGDQLLMIERDGLPIARVRVTITWPGVTFEPVAEPILAELIKNIPVADSTLDAKQCLLGADLRISVWDGALEVMLLAPSSRVGPALEVLAAAFAERKFSKSEFDAAKIAASDWVKGTIETWTFHWETLGLSAPKSRYRYLTPSERKKSLDRLKPSDLNRLWSGLLRQPRAIQLVGPFDTASARNLGAQLVRRTPSSTAPVRTKPVVFNPGVYVIDRVPEAQAGATPAPPEVDACVLWPLARWATPAHYPAHLMSWFLRTDTRDGLGARFSEHQAKIPRWQSNSTLTQDGDFLRYCFHTSLDQLPLILESLRAHLTKMGEGHFALRDFENAIAAERQFQIRQTLSNKSISDALSRAAAHDKQANEALDIALHVERVTPAELSDLSRHLTLEGATIGIIGPAAQISEQLAPLGLKPRRVVTFAAKEEAKKP